MTALSKYERLETCGYWRPDPTSPPQEVIISFGEATLVLSDPATSKPLTHWSLPAIARLNPGNMPAHYSPSSGSSGTVDDEYLEIEDDLMVAAIAQIHHAIAAKTKRPGRLRKALVAVVVLGLIAAGFLWLPDAMERHAARIAAPSQRADIGQMVLNDLVRHTGQTCQNPEAAPAINALAHRLLPPEQLIGILPIAMEHAIALPGPVTLIGQNMLDGDIGPEILTGYILMAKAQRDAVHPLLNALDYAGFIATFRFLTSGRLPEKALAGYGKYLLDAPLPAPNPEQVLAEFSRAKVSSAAFGAQLGTGTVAVMLQEQDPFRDAVPQDILSDNDWIAAQDICR